MTASNWNWLLTIVGTAASVAGVVFSCMAWVQAKGAKRAAEEASRAVKARDTAHEFNQLATDARDLLAAVQAKQKDRATAVANDLTHLLSIALDVRSICLKVLTQNFVSRICKASAVLLESKVFLTNRKNADNFSTAVIRFTGRCAAWLAS